MEHNSTCNYDTMERDLNPSEENKAFVLAGMTPSTILGKDSRAIQFWNFQNYYEKVYLSTVRDFCTRFAQVEVSDDFLAEKLNEIQMEAQRMEIMMKEIEDYEKKTQILKKKTQILQEKIQKTVMENQLLHKAIQKKQNALYRVQRKRDSFRRSLNISSPELDFVHSQRAPQTPSKTLEENMKLPENTYELNKSSSIEN